MSQNEEKNGFSQLSDTIEKVEDTVTFSDVELNETETRTEEVNEKTEAKPEPVLGKKAKTKKKSNPLVMIGSVVGGVSLLIIGGLYFFAQANKPATAEVDNQTPSIEAVIQQKQQEQLSREQRAEEQHQQMLAEQNAQTANNNASSQPIDKAVQNVVNRPFYEQNNSNAQTEQDINLGNSQTMTFSAEGDIYDPNAGNKKEEKPKTVQEIIASKQLNELTNEQLVAAFQILDRTRLETEDSILAVKERMAEKGVSPPSSTIEQRQNLRDMQIAKQVSDKYNQEVIGVLKQLNENVQLLNRNQIMMKQDFEKAIIDISTKIELDKISAEKDKLRYNELSAANKNLLNQYTIDTIMNNRVWLKQKGVANRVSYTIGDNIGNGIVIERIDSNTRTVHTTKGNIK